MYTLLYQRLCNQQFKVSDEDDRFQKFVCYASIKANAKE